jgi:hypothetical protein
MIIVCRKCATHQIIENHLFGSCHACTECKKTAIANLKEPDDVLSRLKRGLAGYVSYLAACQMNEAFSEYVLYEPALRILMARGYAVKCEFPAPGMNMAKKRGDKKRLDFSVTGHGLRFAIEMKWCKKKTLTVNSDHAKLEAFRQHVEQAASYLCVFGKKSIISKLALKPTGFVKIGEPLFAEFGRTRFGCGIYQLPLAPGPVAAGA